MNQFTSLFFFVINKKLSLTWFKRIRVRVRIRVICGKNCVFRQWCRNKFDRSWKYMKFCFNVGWKHVTLSVVCVMERHLQIQNTWSWSYWRMPNLKLWFEERKKIKFRFVNIVKTNICTVNYCLITFCFCWRISRYKEDFTSSCHKYIQYVAILCVWITWSPKNVVLTNLTHLSAQIILFSIS